MQSDQQNANFNPNLNPNMEENQRELEQVPNQNATNLNALNRMREEQGAQGQPAQQGTQNQGAQATTRQTAANQAPIEQNPQEQRLAGDQAARNESGLPGGGVGRTESPGRTGVYPVSADEGANPDASLQGEQAFGQGDRGAAGYQDSGSSEIIPPNELGKGNEEVI